MSAHDIQLGEVVDSDRFKIIDLYKQCPVLWCKEGAGRDKTLAAWNFIAENVSTTERVFTSRFPPYQVNQREIFSPSNPKDCQEPERPIRSSTTQGN